MPPSGLAAVATLLVSVLASGALVWGAAAKKRAADDTLKNARNEADRTLKQAERDAETARKEAALEAREKAHELAAEAEKQARERRQEIIGLEQGLRGWPTRRARWPTGLPPPTGSTKSCGPARKRLPLTNSVPLQRRLRQNR
jgi:hypothetical protein